MRLRLRGDEGRARRHPAGRPKDREAIRAAIFATKNYDGVLGTWSFTDTATRR